MLVTEESDLKTVDFNEVTVKVCNIHSVQAVETLIHCSRRLLQPSAAKIVYCDRCGCTMRSSNCAKQVCVKIVIQLDSGEQINLTAFQTATLSFRKFKVALNPIYRIFLNFAKSCVLSCSSKVYNTIRNSPCRVRIIAP